MSTSSAPALTASLTSASFTASDARPDGNAVATDATATRLPATASLATPTRSGYTQTAATGGTDRSAGSGWRAFAHIARTLPGVSAPSSVVRSTIRTAMSRACSLASFLIDRVASPAARCSAPTSSMPGRPCSTWRNAASEVATSPASKAQRSGVTRVTDSIPTFHTLPLRSPSSRAALGGLASPQLGEAGLDHGVDDPQSFVKRREGALHGVDRQPLDIRPAITERLAQRVE